MSTIVVVKKDDMAVIGADTMAKSRYIKQNAEYVKNNSKICKVGDSYIASVGEASFGLIINNYFSKLKKSPPLSTPNEIFEMALCLQKELKEKYYLRPEDEDDDEFESLRFSSLLANPHGIFGLYDLRSVDEFTKFYSFGSGKELALGAMHALYNTGASAEEIAIAGISAAAEFDDSTGLPYEIFKIKLID